MTAKQIKRVQRLIRADRESHDDDFDGRGNDDIKITFIVGESGVQAIGRYNLKGAGKDIDEAISAAERVIVDRVERRAKECKEHWQRAVKREIATKNELEGKTT